MFPVVSLYWQSKNERLQVLSMANFALCIILGRGVQTNYIWTMHCSHLLLLSLASLGWSSHFSPEQPSSSATFPFVKSFELHPGKMSDNINLTWHSLTSFILDDHFIFSKSSHYKMLSPHYPWLIKDTCERIALFLSKLFIKLIFQFRNSFQDETYSI